MSLPHDTVKQIWEDDTLRFFLWFRREAGGPDYEFVGRREGPDRVIRVVGTEALIGVEITRCVVGNDAAAARRAIAQADRLRSLLTRWTPGGRLTLLAGTFPDTSEKGTERLVTALESAIGAAGSLLTFVETLGNGCWKYADTIFQFQDVGVGYRWHLLHNHLRGAPDGRVAASVLEQLLVDRVAEKLRKVHAYERLGQLLLLIRNPYSVWCPSEATAEMIAGLCRGAFDEVWLVNHQEGVLDLSPPEPRLVRLWPSPAVELGG